MSQFLHEREDFEDLIGALSVDLKIDSQLVEKDYWIMHALWGLQQLGLNFELKGGTSLSKGWKCIDRFSEDIDIYIQPPNGMVVHTGKNHSKNSHVESRRHFFESLAKKIVIPGFSSVERDHNFDDQSQMRNAGIRLFYPNRFGQIPGLKEGVLLEVGFDQTTPSEPIHISSWLLDKAIEVNLPGTLNRAVEVKCYLPEYTFVEKLQTISTKFRRHQMTGQMPANFMRHYYDVYQLLKLERVQKFIGSTEYFKHKEERFRSLDEKDLTKNEAFILGDPKLRKIYEDSFQKTLNLYYKGQPEFSAILSFFSGWLERL
ncbi:MAG: nucleotidyl transferase AbiEii/AbiGii toxin family protein [Pseudobdellovibrionaceae bacterium]